MPTLVSGTGIPMSPGRHQYIINVTSGTVTLDISPDEGASYQTMLKPDGTAAVFSADADGIILLGDCYMKATATGTAVVDINFIGP